MTSTMKTTRINIGIYEVRYNDTTYQVEQYPDGAWLLFEMNDENRREFWNSYQTLRDAKAAIPMLAGDTHHGWWDA